MKMITNFFLLFLQYSDRKSSAFKKILKTPSGEDKPVPFLRSYSNVESGSVPPVDSQAEDYFKRTIEDVPLTSFAPAVSLFTF